MAMREVWRKSWRGPMAALRLLGRRRPRAMVLCRVGLRSQRQLLLVRQGRQKFREMLAMLGPRAAGAHRNSGVV